MTYHLSLPLMLHSYARGGRKNHVANVRPQVSSNFEIIRTRALRGKARGSAFSKFEFIFRYLFFFVILKWTVTSAHGFCVFVKNVMWCDIFKTDWWIVQYIGISFLKEQRNGESGCLVWCIEILTNVWNCMGCPFRMVNFVGEFHFP